ncbi:MAG: hypothetical protein ACPGPF_02040, partial [Pontibacterium sp.]
MENKKKRNKVKLSRLNTSLERQKKLLSASLPLTPVDSLPLGFDGSEAAFLHGFYISDKKKALYQQYESKIQFSGRRHATNDLNDIHAALAEKLNGAQSSLRLLSGLHAHIVVFMSLARIGDSVVLLPEQAGGHFATKKILERLGLKVYELPINFDSLSIDIEQTTNLMHDIAPDFIFIDRSEGLRYEDFSFLQQFTSPIKIFDSSQYLPQIMCAEYISPFEWGFDIQLFTVHKSFPGPQKAGVVTRKSGETWQRLKQGLSDYVSSSHAENTYKFGLALMRDEAISHLASGLAVLARPLENALIERGVPAFSRDAQGEKNWPDTQ